MAKDRITVEIIDKGWDKAVSELKKLDKSYTAVGYFGHGGKPSNDIAARAIVNELGATIRVTKKMRGYLAYLGIFLKKATKVIRVPSRPFMRKTSSLFKRKLEERKIIEVNNIIAGKFTARQVLSRLGEYWVGRIKWVLTHVRFKPNSDFTKQQKGSSRPLISTGEMLNSTKHREIMK